MTKRKLYTKKIFFCFFENIFKIDTTEIGALKSYTDIVHFRDTQYGNNVRPWTRFFVTITFFDLKALKLLNK